MNIQLLYIYMAYMAHQFGSPRMEVWCRDSFVCCFLFYTCSADVRDLSHVRRGPSDPQGKKCKCGRLILVASSC